MWRASGCVPRPCPNRAKWSISRLPNTMMLMGEKTCWTNCQIIEDTIGLIKLVYDDLKFKHLSFPVSNLQNAVFEITTRLTTSSLCLIFAVKHTRSSNMQPSIWGFWPWFLSASEGETQKSSRKVGQIWHTSMELLPKTVNNLTISFQSSYCFFLCFFQCINDHKKFNLKSQKFAKNFWGHLGSPILRHFRIICSLSGCVSERMTSAICGSWASISGRSCSSLGPAGCFGIFSLAEECSRRVRPGKTEALETVDGW